MTAFKSSPAPRVLFRGGHGPILNAKADARVYNGTVVPFGPALAVVQTGAIGFEDEGKAYALHLGGEWVFPRVGAGAVERGAPFRWDPAAMAADGKAGGMVPSEEGEAVHALACEPAAAGSPAVAVMLLLPAATPGAAE